MANKCIAFSDAEVSSRIDRYKHWYYSPYGIFLQPLFFACNNKKNAPVGGFIEVEKCYLEDGVRSEYVKIVENRLYSNFVTDVTRYLKQIKRGLLSHAGMIEMIRNNQELKYPAFGERFVDRIKANYSTNDKDDIFMRNLSLVLAHKYDLFTIKI